MLSHTSLAICGAGQTASFSPHSNTTLTWIMVTAISALCLSTRLAKDACVKNCGGYFVKNIIALYAGQARLSALPRLLLRGNASVIRLPFKHDSGYT